MYSKITFNRLEFRLLSPIETGVVTSKFNVPLIMQLAFSGENLTAVSEKLFRPWPEGYST